MILEVYIGIKVFMMSKVLCLFYFEFKFVRQKRESAFMKTKSTENAPLLKSDNGLRMSEPKIVVSIKSAG